MGTNLELRNNEKKITVSVMRAYFKHAAEAEPISLGHAGTGTITVGEELFTPEIGSPRRDATPRVTKQTCTVAIDFKAQTDIDVLRTAIAGITKTTGVTHKFYVDEKQRIDLSSASGFTEAVPEGNFTESAAVTLYAPNGVTEATLGTHFTVTPATGTITVLAAGQATFGKADALVTYEYNDTSTRIAYGGGDVCDAEDAVGVLTVVYQGNEDRVIAPGCKQYVLEVFRARPEGGLEFGIQPDTANPLRVTFRALNDSTKAVGSQLFTIHEQN